jgi:hypothetical protein
MIYSVSIMYRRTMPKRSGLILNSEGEHVSTIPLKLVEPGRNLESSFMP